jgi:hypothetical protein
MSNEITPTDSVCPIYLEPRDPAQIEADEAEAKTKAKAETAREKAKADVIAKLGLTADEVAALLS